MQLKIIDFISIYLFISFFIFVNLLDELLQDRKQPDKLNQKKKIGKNHSDTLMSDTMG